MAGSFNDQKTGVSAPSGSYCLEVVLDASVETNRYKKQVKPPTNIIYAHEHFQLVSGLVDGHSIRTLPSFDNNGDPVAAWLISRSGSNYYAEFQCYSNGAWQTALMSPESISNGSWYQLQYMYDRANNEWQAALNLSSDEAASVGSGSLSGATRTPNTFSTGLSSASQASGLITTYHDKVVYRLNSWADLPKITLLVTDSVGASDTVSAVLSMVRLFSESVGTADGVLPVVDFIRLVSEALGVTDNVAWLRTVIRRFSDATGISDDTIQAVDMARLLSDTQATTDVSSVFKGIIKKVSEALGLSDAHSHLLTLFIALTENLGITDARTALTILTRLLSDTVAPMDSDSSGGVDFVDTDVVFMDTDVGFKDTGYVSYAIPTVTFRRYLAEAQGLSDDAFTTADYIRNLSEDMNTSDSLADILYMLILKALSENVGVTDSRIALRIMEHVLSDNMGMSDARDRVITFIRLLADLEGLTDLMARYADVDRKISDTAGMTDATVLFSDLARILADNQGITDVVAEAILSTVIERLVSDDAGITDATADAFFTLFWELISDTEGASDQTAVIRSIIRLMSETGTIADDTAIQQDITRHITDTAALTDVMGHVLIIARRISDTLGLSDQATAEILAYALFKLCLLGSQDYMEILPTSAEVMAITLDPQDLIELSMTTFDSEVAA